MRRVRPLLALLLLSQVAPLRAADARLVLLGTAGGPTPKKTRSAPAQAVVVGEDVYVVDCGSGVGRQMARAGLPFRGLRHVFLTHHHSDHAADLITLPLLAWAGGLETAVTLHGPAPIRRSARAGLKAAAFDISTRRGDEGRSDLRELVRVHEIRADGVVHRDGRVTVTAARVDHPPIQEAYAYRFDVAGGRSYVVSGDTAPCPNLVRLARGADVLVHEILLADPHEVARWVRQAPDHPLVRHIVDSHTSFRDVGTVAAEAGVRTLVLSHFVPGDATPDREAVLTEIRKSFGGEVIFGEDLLEIP